MLIHCFEPRGQPRRASIELGENLRFAIYAVQDLLNEDSKGLRTTVLRRPDQAKPPNAQFVVELEVRRRRGGETPGFRVVRVGQAITVEWLRHDGRSKVTTSTDLRSGARFEATLPDMRTVIFSIEVATEVAQGAGATGGGKGPAGSNLAAASATWMVPVAAALFSDPLTRVKAMAVRAAAKAGLSPALIIPAMLTLTMLLGAVAVAGVSYMQKADAEEQLAKVKADLDQAKAARDAAIIAESACVEERKDIAAVLDDVEEARKLQAEVAMAVPMSQSVAVELGGARMASSEALEYDLIAVANAKKYVVAAMGKKRNALGDPKRCQGQVAALGQDLPAYLLVYHPKKELLCPEEYVEADGAVMRAGPWGLSQRVADEFGAPQNLSDSAASGFGDTSTDPRLNHRWSAHAMTVGVREVMETLLDADTGERPPVAPGQAHLWALAVWDAYNHLSSSAGGVMDKPADECVEDLLGQVAAAGGPAEPGQPVLPDITLVANGETVPLSPTASCPWAADALEAGAKSALESVTRLALQQLEAAESEG